MNCDAMREFVDDVFGTAVLLAMFALAVTVTVAEDVISWCFED